MTWLERARVRVQLCGVGAVGVWKAPTAGVHVVVHARVQVHPKDGDEEDPYDERDQHPSDRDERRVDLIEERGGATQL